MSLKMFLSFSKERQAKMPRCQKLPLSDVATGVMRMILW